MGILASKSGLQELVCWFRYRQSAAQMADENEQYQGAHGNADFASYLFVRVVCFVAIMVFIEAAATLLGFAGLLIDTVLSLPAILGVSLCGSNLGAYPIIALTISTGFYAAIFVIIDFCRLKRKSRRYSMRKV